MDYASVGQSIARVGVFAVGTPALIVLVLVLIFLLVRNPKLFRLKMIGLHYEGFDPAPPKDNRLQDDKMDVPSAKLRPRPSRRKAKP